MVNHDDNELDQSQTAVSVELVIFVVKVFVFLYL